MVALVLLLLITRTDFVEVEVVAMLPNASEVGRKTSRRVRAHGLMPMGEFATLETVKSTERASAA